MTMASLLAMHNVTHRFNGRVVLDIPFLAIEAGSITGLAGPNGSGKTTLLKILSLVEKCTSGSVLFQGRTSCPFADSSRFHITLLLQEPYLLKRSVYDNIAYGLKLRGLTEGLEKKVDAVLELVGLSASFKRRQWHELSGGETQRIALAARLVLRPDCLLLDEPTASVDLQSAERIKQAIQLAREEWGTTIIISSHQGHWLQTICDQIIFLFNGRILPFSPENILAGPWHTEENGRMSKILADGQKFELPARTTESDCAALPPSTITIVKQGKGKPSDNILQGRITGILEKDIKEGKVSLHVLCGEQQFALEMSKDHLHDLQLQTGQQARLAFSTEDIVWLPC
jgi:tungstate transport system ATP-binding protein